jgi:hypothetical protein
MSQKANSTREDFNYWVADMDDALARFSATLPPAVRDKLDYSPASLDVLEKWLLENYDTPQQLIAPGQTVNLDGAARYIGETYRKTLGGYWDIELKNPKDVYFGVPIITGFEAKPTPAAPLYMATAAMDRRTGNYIRTALENYMARVSGNKT